MVVVLLTHSLAYADEFGLKTIKSVGTPLTIALNAGVTANFTWSSGDTETVLFDGSPKQIPIKADSVTIDSQESITALYLPNNGIVSLNTQKLGSLTRLICPSNELEELNLLLNTQLEELDCQDNKLLSLDVQPCLKLNALNCSRNLLTSLEYPSSSSIVTLLCAENSITTLHHQTTLTNVETLWCQKNGIGVLDLSSAKELQLLVASSNNLSQIELTGASKLTNVWVENNMLTSLNLSAASTLQRLSVNDNLLREIVWNPTCSSTFTHFYAQNNQLAYNSLPTIYNPSTSQYTITAVIAPQRAYEVEQMVPINTEQSFSTFLLHNGWGSLVDGVSQVTNQQGELLIKDIDYTINSQNYTFITPQQGVTVATTSGSYPALTVQTSPFDVYDSTTELVNSKNEPLLLLAEKNRLTVQSEQATNIKIHTLNGALLINSPIGAGLTHWVLPTGVYFVNGTKVVIP